MPYQPLPIETQQAIWADHDAGVLVSESARRLKLSNDTVRKYRRLRPAGDRRTQPPVIRPTVPADAVAEMKAAADAQEAQDEYEESAEVVWKREEERSARAIRKAIAQTKFTWRAPGQHLILTFPSDQHIAPGTPVDFKAMREDAELTRATPNCYAIALGDGVDNHIKHRAAVLAARSQPDDQYRLFEYYLSIFGDRLILVVRGNHEGWTNQLAGVDLLGRIVKERRILYAPFEGYMDIGVGTQTYTIGVRHQFRMNSTFNQTHSVKQWLRLGEQEFDIGVIGHHHEHAMESFIYRGRLRWGCRPGSYQITSAYSAEYGYNRSIPTSPVFLLRGDRREIAGWPTMKQMAESCRAARELGVA